MDCEIVRGLLINESEMSMDTQASLVGHLKICPECSGIYEKLCNETDNGMDAIRKFLETPFDDLTPERRKLQAATKHLMIPAA